MQIKYRTNAALRTEDIISVLDDSGIRRPTNDPGRIRKMFDHADLVISAWDGMQLIGIARSLTDFSYCCYLSDLAVKKEYQKSGIGKTLIELTQQAIGENCILLLLSAPEAVEYYPKVGFEKVENGFIIKRSS
jgi:ribosomal protein S18 acetylase RimI-like enzyme